MNKLSVALAVFNEEKNLKRCLDSVKKIASEIVVVDGGSTDKTVEIAKKFKARVIETDNPLIFHINKQKAIDAAKGDWILQLDADERVSEKLGKEINEVVRTNGGEYAAFWLPRRNYFLGRFMRKTGMYPDPVIRLFKKGKAYLPCKNVHEQMEVEGKTGFLKNDLQHYPYADFSEYLKKWNRYTSLEAKGYKREKVKTDFLTKVKYIKILPLLRFTELFFRHKGFMDGFPGFVFSYFSGLYIKTAYIKYLEMEGKI